MVGSQSPEVRIATDAASREAVYRFRYNEYVLGMGRHLSGCNVEAQMLTEPHDDESLHYYVADPTGAIAAVVTTTRLDARNYPGHWHTSFPLDRFADLPAGTMSVCSRLVARQDFRGNPALLRLFTKLYADFVGSHGLLNFAYCALPLVRLYSRLGYRRFRSGFNTPEGTFRVPLVLDLQDREHLELVGSPFLKIPWWQQASRPLPNKAWTMEERLPGVNAYPRDGLMLDRETGLRFWNILSRERHGKPHWDAPSFDQVQRWIRRGIAVDLQDGDCPLPPGMTSECLYFCMEGDFDLRKDGERIKTLGPGSFVGGRSALVEEERRYGAYVRGSGRLLALEKPGGIGFRLLGPTVADNILNFLSREAGVDIRKMP